MKNSSTSCAASEAGRGRLALAPLPALLLCAVLTALAGCGTPPESRGLGELTNPFLGPEYSAWLVGPISHIASPHEVEQYLAVQDDRAAAAFIDDFWKRRNPTPTRPVNPLLQAFEERSKEADHLYSEAGFSGRRTDRGTTLVLYGPPRKISFDVAPGGVPVEVWTYGPDASAGLDAKRPGSEVRFTKRGELTVFYLQRPADTRLHGRPQPGVQPP